MPLLGELVLDQFGAKLVRFDARADQLHQLDQRTDRRTLLAQS
jgi:hypothetical protein